MPAGPLAAANQLDAFDEPARRGENQRPRQIGGRLSENAWGVRDKHLAHLGRDEIDVVVAHSDIRDDAEIGKVLELGSTNPARQQRHECYPVALGSWFRAGQPCDIEVYKLRGLNEILDLGSDEYSMSQSTFRPLGPTYSDCGRIR